MDNFEAKGILEKWLEIDNHYYDTEPESDFDKFVSEQDEAVERAIIALEKSIPRKPDKQPGNFWGTYFCPNCGTHIFKDLRTNYCSNCGQKFQW